MFCCIYMCAYDINVFTSNYYILLFLFFSKIHTFDYKYIYIIHARTHTHIFLLIGLRQGILLWRPDPGLADFISFQAKGSRIYVYHGPGSSTYYIFS